MAIQKVFAILLVFAVVGNIFGAVIVRNERSIESGHRHNREAEKNSCEHRTPCGWAVYKRLTRQIDFFMKNSCECPEGKKCVQDDDDISVSAYVYRCVKQEPKPEKNQDEEKKSEAESSRTR